MKITYYCLYDGSFCEYIKLSIRQIEVADLGDCERIYTGDMPEDMTIPVFFCGRRR